MNNNSIDPNDDSKTIKVEEINKNEVSNGESSESNENGDDGKISTSFRAMKSEEERTNSGLSSNKVFPERLPPIKRPRRSNNQNNSGFEISWKDLTYVVEKSRFSLSSQRFKIILKGLTGHFRSRELTALMGPSGAGKTTLLSCVCGERTSGVSGEIKVIGSEEIKVSIITQDDYLWDHFTLKESMLFASKVKNGRNVVNHESIIKNIVKILGLEVCLNTKLQRCSGGQRKRISIALELVSKPNILVLDEPTSGLDSVSCYQTIKTLRDLTDQKEPLAVIATIHQPSARVFALFHSVYVISRNGECIFHGSPSTLNDRLISIGIECPNFHNPADYIAEIASGEHGEAAIMKLSHKREELMFDDNNNNPLRQQPNSRNINELMLNTKKPNWSRLWLLVIRNIKTLPSEPYLSWFRVIAFLITGITLGLLFPSDTGDYIGCPPTKQELYKADLTQLMDEFEKGLTKLFENFGAIFFSGIFFLFGGVMPMVLVFPKEFNVLHKEYINGWYSLITYYLSKVFVEFPIHLVLPSLLVVPWYLMTGQAMEWWRFMVYSISAIGLVLIGQSQGMAVSAIFSHQMPQAAFAGMITVIPFIIFGGFLVRYQRMPWYLQPIAHFCHMKYALEAMLISQYGFNRCHREPVNETQTVEPSWIKWLKLINFHKKHKEEEDYENYEAEDYEGDQNDPIKKILALFSPYGGSGEIDYNKSMVMDLFDLQDDMLYRNIAILFLFVLFCQLMAFSVLYWKIKKSKD